MNRPAADRAPVPAEPSTSRLRSSPVIALGSGILACAPALIVTGSVVLCALVALFTVACVGFAALMI